VTWDNGVLAYNSDWTLANNTSTKEILTLKLSRFFDSIVLWAAVSCMTDAFVDFQYRNFADNYMVRLFDSFSRSRLVSQMKRVFVFCLAQFWPAKFTLFSYEAIENGTVGSTSGPVDVYFQVSFTLPHVILILLFI
jgi:hypothetical protein